MNNWDKREERFEKHPIAYTGWWALGITLVVLGIIALVGVATTGSIFFNSAASNVTLKPRINVQRNDTNNAVASITFFHQTCTDAQAQLRIVENNQARYDADLKAARDTTDPIAAQQAVQSLVSAQSDVTGAENVLQTTVANYNAKAANSLNAKFRESGLPERIVLPDPVPTGYTIDCG